jgi:hypothetical protein
MIPKRVDPGYLDGDEFEGPLGTSEVGPIFRALSSKAAFQHVCFLSLSLDVHALN